MRSIWHSDYSKASRFGKESGTRRLIKWLVGAVAIVAAAVLVAAVVIQLSDVAQTAESQAAANLKHGQSNCSFNDTEVDIRMLQRANEEYEANMQKRVDFFGPSRPSEMDIGQLWLGQYVPTFPCPSLVRMGSLGDGGKWICHVPRLYRSSPPVVVSIGSFGMYGFEQEAHRRMGARVYTFDPFLNTTQKAAVVSQPYINFFEIGLKGTNDSHLFRYKRRAPGKTFLTWPQLLPFLNVSFIDVLKVDCEGCEYSLVRDIAEMYGATRQPPIGQFQVEVHHLKSWTLKHLFYPLEDMGFRLMMNEINPYCDAKQAEFSFVHESVLQV